MNILARSPERGCRSGPRTHCDNFLIVHRDPSSSARRVLPQIKAHRWVGRVARNAAPERRLRGSEVHPQMFLPTITTDSQDVGAVVALDRLDTIDDFV